MKVLQINSVCGVGSTGRIAKDIHDVLIGRDHESVIAYGRSRAISCENTIKIGGKLNNYFHLVKTRLLDRHGFASRSATKVLLKQVEELNPDIIHLHNIHGYYINIELLFKYIKYANKPVVWTLHDCWPITGHCAFFDYVNCNRWKKQCFDCPQIRQYPTSIILDNSKENYLRKKEIFSRVNHLTFVTPSVWLSDIVQQSYLGAYSTKVIPNGIDLGCFKPIQSYFRREYNIDDKFMVLGVASVWDRRKGLQYFNQLAKELGKEMVVVLVGISDKQKKDLADSIIGITRTDNVQQLAEIYSAADVFVNPTLEDNFPTTNIEALACGTPVVTFDTGGSPESINEQCGLVVEKGSKDGLIDAINIVKKNGKAHYSKHCRNRAEKRYNKDDRFNDYISLYDRLMK